EGFTPVNEAQQKNQQKMSFPHRGWLIFGCNFVTYRFQTARVCSLFVPCFTKKLVSQMAN
ncbi:MAG: hypothetical protein KAI33_10815, partial [Elusimicrobiales bacterium]|nr:hypothetical protein [Elusimicrobiales bacterium]